MQQAEEFIDFEIERFMAHRLELPVRTAWTKTQIAFYLKSQGLVGSRRGTIANWETKLCYYIKDFRTQMPKDSNDVPIAGSVFTQYQFAVIVRLAHVMTQLRPYCNGSEYINIIQRTVKNREIQRRYFSYQAWRYDRNVA